MKHKTVVVIMKHKGVLIIMKHKPEVNIMKQEAMVIKRNKKKTEKEVISK